MPVVIKENIVTCKEDYVLMKPWIKPDGSKGYIPIPKVASSTMTRVLSHDNNWDRREIPEGCQMFALIRHPYQRWLSGVTEMWNPKLVREGKDLTPLIDMSPEDLFKYNTYDRHIAPQHWNFETYTNVLLFKIEHFYKLWKWLEIENPEVHERNHLNMGGLEKEIRTIVYKKNLFPDIMQAYKTDMELWEKAR